MQKSERPPMRITDAEIALLKHIFAEDDELVLSLRKLFLQLPMSQNDSDRIQFIFKENAELDALMAKMFNPELEGDTPLGQLIDYQMVAPTKDKSVHDTYLILKAYERIVEWVKEGLGNITKPIATDKYVKFVVSDDEDEAYIQHTARNMYINYIEIQLNNIKGLAGKKDETVEETKTRLGKDSTK